MVRRGAAWHESGAALAMNRPQSSPTRQDTRDTPELSSTPAAKQRALVAFLMGLFCFLVYLTNLNAMGNGDSWPARLLPFSILREGNLDLDEFKGLVDSGAYFLNPTRDGHLASRYWLGTPILVTPLYAPAVWWSSNTRMRG